MKKKKHQSKKNNSVIYRSAICFLIICIATILLFVLFQPRSTTYTGTLPCADCSGIQTTLTLSKPSFFAQQGTYTLFLLYEGKSTVPFITLGTWKLQRNSGTVQTILILQSNDHQSATYYAQTITKLEPLDNQFQPITSPFDMSLTKQ